MINKQEFKNIIKEIIREELSNQPGYKIGTIASASGKPTIIFAGEDQPSQKGYSYLASYIPAIGDRVLLAKIGGTYVILGKLITS